MTIFDGTDIFDFDKPVTSAKLNKVALWHGDTLPTAVNNEVPTEGLFLKTDSGTLYVNSGSVAAPVWGIVFIRSQHRRGKTMGRNSFEYSNRMVIV